MNIKDLKVGMVLVYITSNGTRYNVIGIGRTKVYIWWETDSDGYKEDYITVSTLHNYRECKPKTKVVAHITLNGGVLLCKEGSVLEKNRGTNKDLTSIELDLAKMEIK